MHPNESLIEKFYTAFGNRVYARMSECYAPTATFADPIFTLQGKRIGAMWHMLCESGKDLQITFSDIHADDTQGAVNWQARYTFSSTQRRVHNIIRAEFVFQDGHIVQHRDQFDFWRWSRMALGPMGVALGWTPFVHARVVKTANANLERFIAKHPEYQ